MTLIAVLAPVWAAAAQEEVPRHPRPKRPSPNRSVELWVAAGYAWEPKAGSLGARIMIPVHPLADVGFGATVDVTGPRRYQEVNLDLAASPTRLRIFYLGGGLAVQRTHNAGLPTKSIRVTESFLVGFSPWPIRVGGLWPFAELRVTSRNNGGNRVWFGLRADLGGANRGAVAETASSWR